MEILSFFFPEPVILFTLSWLLMKAEGISKIT